MSTGAPSPWGQTHVSCWRIPALPDSECSPLGLVSVRGTWEEARAVGGGGTLGHWEPQLLATIQRCSVIETALVQTPEHHHRPLLPSTKHSPLRLAGSRHDKKDFVIYFVKEWAHSSRQALTLCSLLTHFPTQYHSLKFLYYFLWSFINYSWFTMLWYLLLNNKAIQLYIYPYPFFFRFFSHIVYYRILDGVLWMFFFKWKCS